MSEFEDQLDVFFDRAREGALTPKEVQEMEDILRSDPELRKQFVERMWLGEELLDTFQEQAESGQTLPFEYELPQTSRSGLLGWAMGIAAVIAVLLTLTFFNRNAPSPTADSSTTVAVMVSSNSDSWSLPPKQDANGRIQPGTVRLESGVANIRFDSDALLSLEGPAELIIETPMRARLVSGKALVEAPESAHGFELALPEGKAVDLGTRFSAFVSSEGSLCEVLDGDIMIEHKETDASHHLKRGEVMLMKSQELVSLNYTPSRNFAPWSQEAELFKASKAATVSLSGAEEGTVGDHLLLVKMEPGSHMQRRALFSIETGDVVKQTPESAALNLNLVPSGIGFAAYLPKDITFAVYGIIDESQEDFPTTDASWQETPGHVEGWENRVNKDEAMLLGKIEISSGQQRGNFQITGEPLLDFISKDTNGKLSFLIVRETYGTQDYSLVHAFAGINHTESSGPSLKLVYPEDETNEVLQATNTARTSGQK